MPWASSDRRSRLPKDWHKVRARTWLAAGGRCQWVTDGARCQWTGRLNGDGGQADHIIRGAGDQPANMQLLCSTHHTVKTQLESVAARPTRKRNTEQHPGLIT